MGFMVKGLVVVALTASAWLAAAEEPAASVRLQPVKDWENCKECGQKPVDPRFRGYTSGNYHSKFHGNWFKDEGKGPQEYYGTAANNQRPAPHTIPVKADPLINKDMFPEENTADDFHSDSPVRVADLTPNLGIQAAINATANMVNDNVIKPVANSLPNVSFPDMTSERHRHHPAGQYLPVKLRPANKTIPCNESAINSSTTSAGGPKLFQPCTPGLDCGVSKKEKYTRCVKDVAHLPEEEDRENTEAPMGGVPHAPGQGVNSTGGGDIFVRKCRPTWWPHPMCESERALIGMMMPKTKGMNSSDGVKATVTLPQSADERALWMEGKTRAASNCAMCEVLLDFKVAEDVLTPINCALASQKKDLAVAQRTTLFAEMAELKVELEGAKFKVRHNETIPSCPEPCTQPRNDTMVTRQRALKVAELKIQRKQEELDRVATAIVMLADMESACPRLREHFESYELELRAEVEEWAGVRIAQREICRKMRCC